MTIGSAGGSISQCVTQICLYVCTCSLTLSVFLSHTLTHTLSFTLSFTQTLLHTIILLRSHSLSHSTQILYTLSLFPFLPSFLSFWHICTNFVHICFTSQIWLFKVMFVGLAIFIWYIMLFLKLFLWFKMLSSLILCPMFYPHSICHLLPHCSKENFWQVQRGGSEREETGIREETWRCSATAGPDQETEER